MAKSYEILDSNGNVIEGATISRLPSADVQARKAARALVGLSDRGRIPETVQDLANGVIHADEVSNAVGYLVASLDNAKGFTDTEVNAVQAVIDNKNKCLDVYNSMQAEGVTLSDLSKGEDTTEQPSE